MQREVITGLGGGESNLIPPLLSDPVGAGLLDVVHPVDRPSVAEWIAGGLGVSQPFRRAAADEPPRWFRFVAVSSVQGDVSSSILMEEVTERVREELLRQRLSSTLARNTGAELVESAARVAAELAGAEAACLIEIHPPLGVVRATHGRKALGQGTTFPLATSPLSRLGGESGILELSEGALAEFPDWGPFRVLNAQFVAMVPVLDSMVGELVGGLVCYSSVPGVLSPVERELLGFLATRLGAELGRSEPPERFGDLGNAVLEVSESFLRVLAVAISGRGITHTLNNLLGGQLLNAELAVQSSSGGLDGNPYLERVIMTSGKGAAIMRRLSSLTGWGEAQRDFVRLPDVVEEAVQLVHDLYEASRIEVRGTESQVVVWAAPTLLRAMVLALVAPAVEHLGPETRVVLEVCRREAEGMAGLDLEISGPALPLRLDEDLGEGMELGMAVAARVAALHGGRLEQDETEGQLKIRATLRALPAGA